MALDLTFIHLSDLHLADPAVPDPHLLSDTGATLGLVIGQIKALVPRPAFVAVSGDLTNRAAPAAYRLLAEALATLDSPAVLCRGNHDDEPRCAAAFPDLAGSRLRIRVIEGVKVVAIDTNLPDRVGGAIEEAVTAALATTLAEEPDQPAVIVMHHPPAIAAPGSWATLDDASTARLGAAIAGRRVAAILTGHIHIDRVALWQGVPVLTVSGQHATTDALYADGLRSVRGASFALCRLTEAGVSATFIQLPSDRAELGRLSRAAVLALA